MKLGNLKGLESRLTHFLNDSSQTQPSITSTLSAASAASSAVPKEQRGSRRMPLTAWELAQSLYTRWTEGAEVLDSVLPGHLLSVSFGDNVSPVASKSHSI